MPPASGTGSFMARAYSRRASFWLWLRFLGTAMFTVTKWDEESGACLDRIFPRRDMPLEALAEDTSLQRAAKAFLRGGGKIGWADGVLTREP